MTTDSTTSQTMLGKPKLERVLVVISSDLVKPNAPRESTLLMRAVALAKATGCELELFHVCDDPSFGMQFFTSKDEIRHAQKQCVDRDATLIAEIALRLQSEGVTIHHDVRWDHPRTDAILRKISKSQPDLVMKQSRDHSYVMGLIGNTDWDLIRQSSAHLWFVAEGDNTINRLITAVGGNTDQDEMFSAADYQVFRVANMIAEQFGAENTPVHAYQVPLAYSAYAPEFSALAPSTGVVAAVEDTRREIAHKHGQSIEAFAQFFDLDRDRVQIAEGHPGDVLPEAAKSINADLIVMAARNLTRWERLYRSVTAEPVLSETPCDVLFVKDSEDAMVPVADQHPIQGIPAFDLETAITNPEQTFGSPQKLANAVDISIGLKKRILQIWEQDVRAEQAEENEGGLVKKTNANVLSDISRASASLVAGTNRRGNTPAELTG